MQTTALEHNFGPMVQVAYVVPDIEEAIQRWNKALAIGPFAIWRNARPFAGSNASYRGKPCDQVAINLGFAYIGDLQLELIQPCDRSAPSIYTEALDKGHSGPHHFQFLVDDWGTAYRYIMEHNYEPIVQAGDETRGMFYCESRDVPGLIIEVCPRNELTEGVDQAIKDFLESADPAQLIHELDLASLI